MTIPNILTVMRLLLVPVIIWAINADLLEMAFWIFIFAGISDGVDGFIARHFNQMSELGTYLDPLADKALLVSIFIMLGLTGHLPNWLVIAVVSRDLLIVTAVILSWLLNRPVVVRPSIVSKANTLFQIILAATVLGGQAFNLNIGDVSQLLIAVTGGLTLVSAAVYMIDWLRHMTRDVPSD
ncbi:MAG: CDP-alcohol phosphatidyltransferase family protein [Stappiaceae bacterium]